MRKQANKNRLLNGMVYLLLLAVVLTTLLPLGWVISTSIKPSNEVFAPIPKWIPNAPTINSYKNVLLESNIPKAFLNSVIVGGATAFFSLVLGGLAGYAFSRFRFRGSKALSLFMLSSQMLPLTVVMIPMYYMQNNVGLVDTKLGLMIAHLIIAMPLVTWMTKGYFEGIPKEIEEAAVVDGCSSLETLLKIVIPLLRPALAATGVYAFVSSWNEFALANVLTLTITSRTVPVTLNDFSTFFKINWGDTMAAATIITIPTIVVFMSIQKQFIEGLSSGAVKG